MLIRIKDAVVVLLLSATACAQSHRSGSVPTNQGISEVPSLPPTTGLPSNIASQSYATTNLVTRDEMFTGPFPRDLIWVWFRDDASQRDRQEAITAIRGEVVGGFRYRPGGVYYVRIKDDGTAAPLHRAISRLRQFSQVVEATPDLSLTLGPNTSH